MAELTALRQKNSKTFDLGNGQKQVQTTMGAFHYRDEVGDWQDIDDNYSEPDSGDYTARFTKLPYVVRMGDNSGRRIYPDRNDLSYWIELGKPFPSMGAPVKIGGYWVWNFPNAAIGVKIEHESIKFGFRLKNSSAPSSITIPFSSQGITREGRYIFHNGEVVGELKKPFAKDANEVYRDVDIEFGIGEITLSLDTTGLTYPIDVDPTWQVGAATDDCYRRITPSAWDLAQPSQWAGAYSTTSYKMGGGMKIPNVAVPQGSIVISTSIKFRADDDRPYTNKHVLSRISAEDIDDAATFTDNATTFDTRFAAHTTARVAWDYIPAWTKDIDYDSPECKTIEQELVDRPGWASGQDQVWFWEDFDDRSTHSAEAEHGVRSAYSYDGSTTYCPILTVTFAGNVTVTPTTLDLALTTYIPVVSISNNITVTPTTLALNLTTYAPSVVALRILIITSILSRDLSITSILSRDLSITSSLSRDLTFTSRFGEN